MAKSRKIKRVIRSKPTIEGAGVHLKRVFGFSGVRDFDPFLLLDDFRSRDPALYLKGFPWHPHRGIETITYMLGGTVEHGDSMGNSGRIGAGEVQWMTAGSGIIHQEMPRGDSHGVMEGFQLWANLPRSHKMMDPRYRDIKAGDIATVQAANGVTVKVICGRADGTDGPVKDVVIDPQYIDVAMPSSSQFVYPTARGHTVFAYVIQGKACFCDQKDPFSYPAEGSSYFDLQKDPLVGNESLVLFDDGESIHISTEEEPARFLLMAGRPIGEPIAWYGPIVMNTQKELALAFEEYANGTFIRKAGK